MSYRSGSLFAPIPPQQLRPKASLARSLLLISVPLIMNMGSVMLMSFVDRMFLSWYGTEEISAVFPAIFLCWSITSFFYAVSCFVNVFVAQYYGAGNRPMCSAAVWQGVYFSLGAYLAVLAMIVPGRAAFAAFGHRPEIAALERTYFTVLMFASLMSLLNNTLAGFFTGRGKPKVTMTANIIGNAVNVALDWVLIFGHLGAPRLGILGAALATAVASTVPVMILLGLFLARRYQQDYQTRFQWRFRRKLINRLLKIGSPSGVQDLTHFLSMGLFFMFMGRTLPQSLAGNNIGWSINNLLTLYSNGITLGMLTLMSQFFGAGKQDRAEQVAYLGLKILLAAAVVIGALYLIFPEFLLNIFRQRSANPSDVPFELILAQGKMVLRYLVLYNFFYAFLLTMKQALRGAEDTRFFIKITVFLDLLFFIPGIFLVTSIFGTRIHVLWNFLLVYVGLMGLVFFVRFRGGYWRELAHGDLSEKA